MFGIGLLAARMAGKAIWILPVSFVLAMLFGHLISGQGSSIPMVELCIAVSLVLIGILIIVNWNYRVALLLSLVAVFGLVHGHAHGNEMMAMSAGWNLRIIGDIILLRVLSRLAARA